MSHSDGLDFKVPAEIAVWFLETGRFLPVCIRVSRFLFWFWMGKRCCTLKSMMDGPIMENPIYPFILIFRVIMKFSCNLSDSLRLMVWRHERPRVAGPDSPSGAAGPGHGRLQTPQGNIQLKQVIITRQSQRHTRISIRQVKYAYNGIMHYMGYNNRPSVLG